MGCGLEQTSQGAVKHAGETGEKTEGLGSVEVMIVHRYIRKNGYR